MNKANLRSGGVGSVRKPVKRVILLNIGVDQAQLGRRHQILADAGFKVLDADTVEQALQLARRKGVRVAIFGHRIPARDRLAISGALKRQNSAIRIVVMYERSVQNTELADAVLQLGVPPADLVHSIRYLLAEGSGRPVSNQS